MFQFSRTYSMEILKLPTEKSLMQHLLLTVTSLLLLNSLPNSMKHQHLSWPLWKITKNPSQCSLARLSMMKKKISYVKWSSKMRSKDRSSMYLVTLMIDLPASKISSLTKEWKLNAVSREENFLEVKSKELP